MSYEPGVLGVRRWSSVCVIRAIWFPSSITTHNSKLTTQNCQPNVVPAYFAAFAPLTRILTA
jgi:hypothetical protein